MDKVDNSMELDFKNPLSLFCTFLVILCITAWVSQQLPLETKFFGVELTKHVSDIMSEHEAGKSMFALSIYVLSVSYVKYFLSLRSKINVSFNRYAVLAPANFLVSLVFVEMAVTFSVIAMVPKEPVSPWSVLLYLGGKNLALSAFLLSSLAILNNNCQLVSNNLLKLFLSLFLSFLYFLALTW
ncbi:MULTISPECIES: hypothetical protein [Pseudomonas]|uniref:hypothetical protein n=1 Tax=Pseudomonas TaxID=286 RepID=UPI0011AFBE87|nr:MULTISPECIES: hypothetical protein [Pseudomonas]